MRAAGGAERRLERVEGEMRTVNDPSDALFYDCPALMRGEVTTRAGAGAFDAVYAATLITPSQALYLGPADGDNGVDGVILRTPPTPMHVFATTVRRGGSPRLAALTVQLQEVQESARGEVPPNAFLTGAPGPVPVLETLGQGPIVLCDARARDRFRSGTFPWRRWIDDVVAEALRAAAREGSSIAVVPFHGEQEQLMAVGRDAITGEDDAQVLVGGLDGAGALIAVHFVAEAELPADAVSLPQVLDLGEYDRADFDAGVDLVAALDKQVQAAAAAGAFGRIAAARARLARAWVWRGDLARASREVDQATREAESLLTQPESPDAEDARAAAALADYVAAGIALAAGDPGSAIDAAARAQSSAARIDTSALAADAQLLLAAAYDAHGDAGAAMQALVRLADDSVGAPDAKRARAQALVGARLAAQGRFHDAAARFETATALYARARSALATATPDRAAAIGRSIDADAATAAADLDVCRGLAEGERTPYSV